MKNNKFITLEHIRNNYYTYNEIADNGTFPLIEFLTGDYRSFKKFYWEEYFDKGIPIDSGGNTTLIEEKNGLITITFQFINQEEYTTTKEKFFKILERWDKVVAERPPKIIIKEVDGEIIISPLEPDMN